MTAEGKRTELYAEHLKLKAKIVPFGGWLMPVLYTSVIEEHNAVRERVGLFDIGHMGLLDIPKAGLDLKHLEEHCLTRKIADLEAGQIRYNRLLNERQGIVDDILVYNYPDKYLFVVNASNTDKVKNYLKEHQIVYSEPKKKGIALQGPLAEKTMSALCSTAEIKYYRFKEIEVFGEMVLISRTGYTGEDGFEIYTEQAVLFWQKLLTAGAQPCGLGARDTLRLEAAMPLYGHELSDEITDEQSKKLAGLEMLDKAVPREKYRVFTNEKEIGYITSGTFSPTLKKAIAMAYLDSVKLGERVDVEVRGNRHPAVVVSLPFYKRKK
ncbi:MAG: glycine cleavage system aminomethyltransferase GcvT [Candidatus Margulisiibacteriota bacterium]|jgi:aminomethyltransferase